MTVSTHIGLEIVSNDFKAESSKLLHQYEDVERGEPTLPSRRMILFQKLGSALAYGSVSFVLTVINKTVSTTWHFQSFIVISIGQLVGAVIVLSIARMLRIISFPDFSRDLPRKLHPLPVLHFGNMVTGLGDTQAMSLPMFTAIRRFSILWTMLLEFKILGIKPSAAVQFSVWCMIGGAILAACDDLTFTITGYLYVMLANLLTAAYGVYIKEKINTIDMDKFGIMYYNSLLMLVPAIGLAWLTGDLYAAYHFKHWTNPIFLIQFLMTCVMGFVLTFTTFLCTQYNSALTTAMVGCFKNVFVSYLGMIIGGDYIFSAVNCIGINVSVLGSVYYTYIIFAKKETLQNVNKSCQRTFNA